MKIKGKKDSDITSRRKSNVHQRETTIIKSLSKRHFKKTE